MKQEQILGIIRLLLSAVGGFLLGKNLFGTAIDESMWQIILGIAMGVASIVMSILSKTLTIEMVQGTLRQTVSFFGGLFVAKGSISNETLTFILGLVPVLAAWLQSTLAKKKNQQLDSGIIRTSQLKK